MWVLLDSPFLEVSGLPVSGCLFISPGWGSFQPLFWDKLSSPFSLSSPSGTTGMQIVVHLMVSHKSLKLFSLSFIVFSFCFSDWMNSTALSLSLLTLSSTWSSVLLYPSIEFFISVTAFFGSLISVWYFVLFLFFCCWNSHFVHALFSWPQWAYLWLLFWTLNHGNYVSLFHYEVCFWRGFFGLFVWNIFPCFFIFLDSLCWFLCIR